MDVTPKLAVSFTWKLRRSPISLDRMFNPTQNNDEVNVLVV
jgi:hypothetical protein